MIFVNGFFDKKKDVINALKDGFIKDGLDFCREFESSIENEELTDFLIDMYNSITDDEDLMKLKDNFDSLVSKCHNVRYMPSQIFINFLSAYSKMTDYGLKEMIARVENITRSLKARKVVSVQQFALNLNNDTFFEHPINTFTKIKDLGEKITFLNLYDGVNIQNEGSVINVTETNVTISTDPVQIISMKEEGNSYILKNNYFQKHIKADIVDFDLIKGNVILSNFSRVEKMNASLRKHQRVHPNKFTKVYLKGVTQEVVGNLYDISKGGLSVLNAQDIKFEPNEEIRASFELYFNDECKRIEIDLVLVVQINYNGFMRYCMKNLKEQSNEALDKFIDMRVCDAFNELEHLVTSHK